MKEANIKSPVSVVIPTYRREAVLIDTLRFLLALRPSPQEILVLDQTETHEVATAASLRALEDRGDIRWIMLSHPSIPKAMNEGLRLANQNVVLFVDDDISPEPELISSHLRAHAKFADGEVLVAGRVIQPWQEGTDPSKEKTFHFASMRAQWVSEFIGCNFSLNRKTALAMGGFDENFVRVAYRFEAEFAHRFAASGRKIWFEPSACLHHLKEVKGGTRSYGNHLNTWRPDHAVGAYYYGLRTGAWQGIFSRPLRAITTRYHLGHPWQMLGTLWAELRGMAWAWRLHRSGPRYAKPVSVESLND